MKKIVLTGGGSAGHVTPNLALAAELKRRGWQILYIGSDDSCAVPELFDRRIMNIQAFIKGLFETSCLEIAGIIDSTAFLRRRKLQNI